MPKFFVTENNIKNNIISIKKKDINHIKNVLRKKIDDEIMICNTSKEENFMCKIINIEEEKIECEILEKIKENNENNIIIKIFQGLPKSDKMELIIQKSVELGVNQIYPIEMKRSIVRLNEKEKIKKVERWQKISEVASKQCGRNTIPKINSIEAIFNMQIKENCDILIVPYEKEIKNTLKNEIKNIKNNTINNNKKIEIGILIGPEGGIDDTEIEILKKQDSKIVTLGKRILRTETVALNILSILMYELEI